MGLPIAFFAFNRLDHARRSLSALAANGRASESDLIVFCDGPRNEQEKIKTDSVRAYCKTVPGFRSVTVVERENNLGCGRAIEAGLKEFFATHSAGVVVEDDILLAPSALPWFETCLDRYQDEPSVFSIAAWSYPETHLRFPEEYPYDAYFLPRFQCWGWASWADRIARVDWQLNDYEVFSQTPTLIEAFARGGRDLLTTLRGQWAGTIDTWDIQMAYAAFKHGQVSLAPRFAYSTNMGTTGEGTHVGLGQRHPTRDIDLRKALDAPRLPDYVFLDAKLLRAFHRTLRRSQPSLFAKAVHRARR